MAEQEEPVRRKVALKIIKPGMDTREVIGRFEAERQALAIMDHPNIARVLDAGATESGRPFFVMELVRGVPITDFCDQNSLTTRERLELFASVCQAVQHAHQKGIIHRDIKPSNVLVTLRDERPIPKVIDFGVAKATNQRLTEKTVFTRFAQMIGTPLYMSPEQAGMSELDVDTRSDIYSLGVLLYELLTGTTPFDHERLREAAYEELLRIIREEEPPRPSLRITTLGDTLPSVAARRKIEPKKLSSLFRGELDWIVMKALEKDRSRRYETASGFGDDIERYLNDEPVIACPPSAVYRFRKFARRNRAALWMIALVTGTLLLGIVGTSWQAVRATLAEREAATERNRALDAEQSAREEAAISRAVNDFINEDLLSSADPDAEPNRDLKVREVLDRAFQDIEGRFEDQPLVKSQILSTLGNAYHALGEYGKAEKLHSEALEIQRRVLGKEHPDTLRSRNNLAVAIKFQGRHEEAERLHREVLEIRRRVLGSEHPDTLDSMQNLAGAIGIPNGCQEAEELYRDVLTIQRRMLGPEHPDTLNSMCSLAMELNRQGRCEEAEGLLDETLEVQRRVLREMHPDTLISLSALLDVLLRQKRYRRGSEARRRVAEDQNAVCWGPSTLVPSLPSSI